MASPEPSSPLKFKPARDPIVWAFIGLLALTLAFSAFGAYQNNRITGALRDMYQYNHDQLDYVRKAIEKREADLKRQEAEIERMR